MQELLSSPEGVYVQVKRIAKLASLKNDTKLLEWMIILVCLKLLKVKIEMVSKFITLTLSKFNFGNVECQNRLNPSFSDKHVIHIYIYDHICI